MDQNIYACSIVNPNEPNAPPKTFTFDGVYGPDSTTEAIYNDNGFNLVEVNFIELNMCVNTLHLNIRID